MVGGCYVPLEGRYNHSPAAPSIPLTRSSVNSHYKLVDIQFTEHEIKSINYEK